MNVLHVVALIAVVDVVVAVADVVVAAVDVVVAVVDVKQNTARPNDF